MKTRYKIVLLLTVVGNAHAATVTPKITKISVTPTSAIAGTTFKFIAELDDSLPTGYKVKIKLANTLISMTGTKNSYSLSRAIYTIGSQTYKVAIYNAKNALQGKVSSGNFTVKGVTPLNHAPMLSLVKAETSAITNNVYTVTLNSKDIDTNLSSITMNWGDNSEPETLTATDGNDLVFSHIYTSTSSFGWNAFASDKGTPALNSKSISKIVTVSSPDVEVIAPPAKTTGYTKIANNGSELPDDATLGANPTDWACTKDNKTGLIWEVKTNDGGLRDMDNIYTWYNPDLNTNGGFAGYPNDSYFKNYPPICTGSNCDIYAYKEAVSVQELCGLKNWRIPSIDELASIFVPNSYKAYFPNTATDPSFFWSSTPNPTKSSSAFGFDFINGERDSGYKFGSVNVRLVHNP